MAGVLQKVLQDRFRAPDPERIRTGPESRVWGGDAENLRGAEEGRKASSLGVLARRPRFPPFVCINGGFFPF